MYIIVGENTILWIGGWVCSAVLLGGRGEVDNRRHTRRAGERKARMCRCLI